MGSGLAEQVIYWSERWSFDPRLFQSACKMLNPELLLMRSSKCDRQKASTCVWMGERDMLHKVLWVLSPKHWMSVSVCLLTAISGYLKQFQTGGKCRPPRRASQWIPCSSWGPGALSNKNNGNSSFSVFAEQQDRRRCQDIEGGPTFFVLSDGKTFLELEWTQMSTESCISLPGTVRLP